MSMKVDSLFGSLGIRVLSNKTKHHKKQELWKEHQISFKRLYKEDRRHSHCKTHIRCSQQRVEGESEGRVIVKESWKVITTEFFKEMNVR